ncbi:DUF6266 family protein [Pedobacter duraquae]|uniref:Uncharacterized protein n=1 Tax=Pedobacter duraquae TaxID=425511 RepID=A0A4V3C3Z6_9SPHI|nr:DUF6266 family protein [Pedobacter duraquae]TDO23988.1 hypothetical protein CLV32_0275 [Pedobacter duraquae]
MAFAPNGLGGPIYGRLGNYVYYLLNGEPVVRKIGRRIGPRTPQEIRSSNRQSLLVHFFNPMKAFIKKGFGAAAEHTTSNYHNLAMSYNNPKAIAVDTDHPTILYDKILLAKGELLEPAAPNAVIDGDNILFTWEYDEDLHWNFSEDRVMMLIHFPEKGASIFKMTGAERAQGYDTFHLLPGMTTEKMHIYVAFCSSYSEEVSNSIYIREIN